MVNRRTLLQGIAAALILPPTLAENVEAARRYWALDRTMAAPRYDAAMPGVAQSGWWVTTDSTHDPSDEIAQADWRVLKDGQQILVPATRDGNKYTFHGTADDIVLGLTVTKVPMHSRTFTFISINAEFLP